MYVQSLKLEYLLTPNVHIPLYTNYCKYKCIYM